MNRRHREDEDERISYLEGQVERLKTALNVVSSENPYEKIAQLEGQVDRLKHVVHALASALEDHLSLYESQLPAIESRLEDLSKIQASQARAVKRQDDKLRKGLSIVSDALSTLAPTDLQ